MLVIECLINLGSVLTVYRRLNIDLGMVVKVFWSCFVFENLYFYDFIVFVICFVNADCFDCMCSVWSRCI